jgi:acyl dehydratase
MPYYEEFELGQKATSTSRTVTDGMATIMIDLGGFIADQFTNKIEAEKTPLGWRAIPGRVAFTLMGGLVERMGIFDTPGPGMLVGADKLIWKTRLKVGDTIHLEWEVIELRKTSNPRWGLVKNSEKLLNQDGEVICTVEITHLFEYKNK